MKTIKLESSHYTFLVKNPNFTGCVIDGFVDKTYYKNGKCHRENGPAIEYADGDKEYWLDGKRYSYENWKQEVMKLKLSRILRKIDGNS